ncbi:hypothetical protein ON010_g10021 [Phytophthora cinnamomi]|nr:hypothetical protein ON010_g10021 [Phytophthora cinnamomi]
MIDDVLDDAFLSELSVLLAGNPLQAPPAGGAHDALLLASNQLIEETEALLSSCSSSPEGTSADNTQPERVCDARTTPEAKSQVLDERQKVRNANAAKRRLKYAKKVKDEKEQLVAKLAGLKATKSENKWIMERTRSMPVWRAIATRQLQGRLVAETERRRLRELVAARATLIHELGEKMRRHLQGSGVSMDETEGQSAPPLEQEDVLLFDKYLLEVDTAFDGIDEVHRAWRVEDAPLSSVRARPSGEGLKYFENLDVQLTPFDFRRTGDALWESMRLVHFRSDRQRYRSVVDLDSVIAVKFQVGNNCQDASNLIIRIVMKRRVEPERIVILWRAHTKGEGELNGIHADETGWSVVRPTDAESKSAVGMSTAILTFIRFVPYNAKGCESKLAQFLKLAEFSGHEHGAEIVRSMESILLDGARSTQLGC